MPRKLIAFVLLLLFSSLLLAQSSPDFRAVDELLNKAVSDGAIPGAVAMVGHRGRVVYRKAFGMRSLEPVREAMTVDTIFDAASLTKCLVTATGIMQLVESGQVRLNDPVAKYIPEFGVNGKQEITIRQLATHFSGMAEDLDPRQPWLGKQGAYAAANAQVLVSVPGSEFRYSDINFIVLGELIEKVSGMSLERYAQEKIFGPLGMTTTRYLPPQSWTARIAPTEYDDRHHMMRGWVHDPSAGRMGGVAGHAGVFTTADDLARFAEAILSKKFVVSPAGVEKMSTPQQPVTSTTLRGIGWDIDSPFSSNRGELLPLGSFGHTGFTGTSLWIDPTTNSYLILMTNAVHPRLRPGAPAVALRSKFASAVAAAVRVATPASTEEKLAAITGYNESLVGARRLQARNGRVVLPIDQVEQSGALFATNALDSNRTRPLGCGQRKCRIGLLTNQTGLTGTGKRTIDVLAHLRDAELTAIFSPEHGVTGTVDTTEIGNTKDAATGVPVYSVYGAKDAQRRPSPDVVKTLDALVFDIQDAGVRWYTFETTLGYFLEASAKSRIPLIVMDRPNPITATFVQGPVSDPGTQSFTNYHPVPVRHGMTFGELAQMFNAERKIGAELHVFRMSGYQRGDWFDATSLTWTNPSPNLRNLTEATLYPGVALVEGTNVSVGRGTDSPFEVLGAPWIDARQFATYLNERNLAGVRFVPAQFTPTSSNYVNQLCNGVQFIVTDRNALDSAELGVELASALMRLYPRQYDAHRLPELLVNAETFEALKRGDDPRRIADEWRDALVKFKAIRSRYLLY